mmetsp:Transcript_33149/g.102341  ORF Transcript_33149/g.102341 Transcript_33149/m.102341 type:complete len:266 (+) Transcript_33149:1066-1863(+)
MPAHRSFGHATNPLRPWRCVASARCAAAKRTSLAMKSTSWTATGCAQACTGQTIPSLQARERKCCSRQRVHARCWQPASVNERSRRCAQRTHVSSSSASWSPFATSAEGACGAPGDDPTPSVLAASNNPRLPSSRAVRAASVAKIVMVGRETYSSASSSDVARSTLQLASACFSALFLFLAFTSPRHVRENDCTFAAIASSAAVEMSRQSCFSFDSWRSAGEKSVTSRRSRSTTVPLSAPWQPGRPAFRSYRRSCMPLMVPNTSS